MTGVVSRDLDLALPLFCGRPSGQSRVGVCLRVPGAFDSEWILGPGKGREWTFGSRGAIEVDGTGSCVWQLFPPLAGPV